MNLQSVSIPLALTNVYVRNWSPTNLCRVARSRTAFGPRSSPTQSIGDLGSARLPQPAVPRVRDYRRHTAVVPHACTVPKKETRRRVGPSFAAPGIRAARGRPALRRPRAHAKRRHSINPIMSAAVPWALWGTATSVGRAMPSRNPK